MSDTLPVGDELKRLIHQHVFDKPIFTEEYMRSEALEVWETQPSCIWFSEGFDAWREGDKVCVMQVFPDYLTGDGMLKIVAAMKEKGWCWYAGEDGEGTFFRFVKQGAGENGADLMASCETFAVELNCAYAALSAFGVL